MTRTSGGRAHIVRATVASTWAYAGRGIGLGWTIALVAGLSVGDYGLYAIAFAASGLVVGLLDNPFYVGSLRVEQNRFELELRARNLIALIAMCCGALCLFLGGGTVGGAGLVVGFALVIAGGEIAMNAIKARSLRGGIVDRVNILDLVRQASSVALGLLVLAAAPQTGLLGVVGAYCVPYVAALVVSLARNGIGLSRYAGGGREWLALSGGALAGAGYAQGDVIVLGVVAGSDAAGVYSIGSLIAWSAASLIQNYASSHVEAIRTDKHRFGLARIAIVSGALGLVVCGAGLGAWALGVMQPLGLVLLLLGPFTAMRGVNHCLTIELSIAKRDLVRLIATVLTVAVDLLLVCALAGIGAIGAAVAASAAELLLLSIYLRARRPAPDPRTPPTEGHRGQ